ncbi:hypothetical protein FAVG1_01063 [Fusarium avenaceum]|nr:hypothetical protein FAVG1_01063 [Fusarium avenaceum]
MKITAEMRCCQYEDCNLKKTDGGVATHLAAGLAVWSRHPTRANWVICRNCKRREGERLYEEELKRRSKLVDRRVHTINEKDKVCTEDGCEDPYQNGIQARMHAGQFIYAPDGGQQLLFAVAHGTDRYNLLEHGGFSSPTDMRWVAHIAAWEKIKQVTAEKDLNDIKQAIQKYIKAINGEVTYRQLQETFIDQNLSLWLIPTERSLV